MSRYGRRVSRSLIGVLIVTLILGLVFYLKNIKSTQAQETSPGSGVSATALTQKSANQTPPAKVFAAVPGNVQKPATQPAAFTARTPTPGPSAMTIVAREAAAAPATRPVGLPGNPPPSDSTPARDPLAEATARKNSGDLLGARRSLNAALLSGALSAADAETARKTLADINQTVVFSTKRFADDEFGGTYSVQSGDLLKKIAEQHEIPWELLGRLNGLSDPRKLRAGATLKVIRGPFNVVVTKSKFTMDLYLGPAGEKGSMYITTFPVGLGKDDSTPTGTWMVEVHKKLKNPTYYSPRGEGVIDSGDPKNPLGDRWIGLSGIDGHAVGQSSYGIHGTIDDTSIGKQSSMGCIRMHNADVELVFDLLTEGKSVVVVRN